VLAGHVAAYYFLDWTRIGAIDFQAFFHHFLGEGLLTAGALFAILMFGGALVFGRLFCSWGCHFGATQDLAAWALRKLGWKPPLVRTRFLHLTPYLILVAVFGIPLAERWLEKGWETPRVDMAAVAPWDTLPGWILSIVTFLACGAGILLFLGTRGFCRFVCPYGAVFRLTDRAAPFRVRKVGACSSGCSGGGAHPCTAACPTAIDVHREAETLGRVDAADCIRCNLCIEACPADALAHVTAGAAERRLVPGGGGRPPPRRPRDSAASPSSAPDGRRAPAGDNPVTWHPDVDGTDMVPGSLLLEVQRKTAAWKSLPVLPAPRPAYDLPLAGEAAILGVAVLTYLAVDLVYGGHFLAATLALGHGFLAWAALSALRGGADAAVLGLRLRQADRWTFAGIGAVGLFAIACIPVLEAGAFRLIRADALRLDAEADAMAAPAALEEKAVEPGLAAASRRLEERRRLTLAAERYRLALAIFPSDLTTRRLLLGVYARIGDPRALDEAREIRRRSPDGDSWAREALEWTERRFAGVSSAAPGGAERRPE
jgi:ferredoxin